MTKFQSYICAVARAKSVALCMLFAMLAASFMPTSEARAQANAPDAVIDSTRYDFGDVFAGEVLEHIFTLRNNGSAPLELAEKSVTTGSNLSWPRADIKAVSFKPGNALRDYSLASAAALARSAPS